eukprot:COSAG01_NODE_6991_length_3401_cov_3.070000_5_plen_47_part_00
MIERRGAAALSLRQAQDVAMTTIKSGTLYKVSSHVPADSLMCHGSP